MRALREELYAGSWSSIDWEARQDTVSGVDVYRRSSRILKGVNRVMDRVEALALRKVRDRALREVLDHITYEDDVTSGIDIGPVNKVLNAFVHFFDDPDGPRLARALERTDDYLWDGPDGTKMQGYNGSQLWDTAFAVQALLASPSRTDAEDVIARAYDFIRDNRDPRGRPRPGALLPPRIARRLAFLDARPRLADHRLHVRGAQVRPRARGTIPARRSPRAARTTPSGSSSRGRTTTAAGRPTSGSAPGASMERLNPSEVFGDIMVDYSYVECTSACVQALAAARTHARAPERRARSTAPSSRRSPSCGRRSDPTGASRGRGRCASPTGHGLASAASSPAGASPTGRRRAPARASFCSEAARRRAAGGKHGDSCREHRWIEAAEGHVVQTSWALMALVRAGHTDVERDATRGRRSSSSARTRREGGRRSRSSASSTGPVSSTTTTTATYFPLWALSEYLQRGGCAS